MRTTAAHDCLFCCSITVLQTTPRMSNAAPTAAATSGSMHDIEEPAAAAATPQPLPSPPAGRARAGSGARASKHPLLPAAIALGAGATPLPLASALSPGSEAKRMRTGEHTPGGSGSTAQWIAESPMSPATTQMQVAMQHARIGSQTPTGVVGAGGAGAGKLVFGGPVPPSPSRDSAAALPPTHPHTSPSPTAASSHSIYSATTSTHAASSIATTGISPSRSSHSSAASSPSSTFSMGAGSHSSASIPAVPTSPVSLSPTALPHSSAASVTSVAPLPIAPAPASVTTTTPRRTAAAAAAAARHSPAAAHVTPPREAEEDEDEDDGPATGSKKKDGKGQGASCHQCKTAKDEQHLLFCTTKAGGARRRRCRKKYCDSCLARTYGVDVKALMNSSDLSTWSCPSCLGKCTCAGCARKTTVGGGGGGRASHATTSLAIPPALLESVAPPTKKLTKAQQAQLQRELQQQQEQKLDPAAGVSGAHYLPAAHATFGTLPAAGGYSGRAISAPLHDSYMQHAYNSSQQQQLHAYEAAAAAAVANAAKLDAAAAAASRPPMLDSTATAPSSSVQDTSPVHLDLIASMLLELTGASSASSTAPATVSAPHSSEMAGASSSSYAAASAPLLPAQPSLTHTSPPKTAMPASLDPTRLAALRASGGRPMPPVQPYQTPAPFAFAGGGGGGSLAGSAGVAGVGAAARFPSHSPVSLLQSSSSFGLRSSPPGAHVPLKYASLLSGGGGMTLPGAPARDQRAQSETMLMSGATVAGWKRAYDTTQQPEANH